MILIRIKNNNNIDFKSSLNSHKIKNTKDNTYNSNKI